MDWVLGAGLSVDIIENWIDVSLDGTYGISASRTGSAYESAQIVKDGEMRHIASIPRSNHAMDILISFGLIL